MQQQEGVEIKLCEAVTQLRTARKFTPSQFADAIGKPHHVNMVHVWEQGRGLPSNHALSLLSTMAYNLGRHDLADVFKRAKQDTRVDRAAKEEVSVEKAARQHGREGALLEVMHLIDERTAEIRHRVNMYDRDYERGMSIGDIVATEVDMLKASIRALPTYTVTRTQKKEGRP